MEKIKEIYSYREVVRNFVARDLKTRYKGSGLGFFWSFLNPLLNMAVLAIVFSFVIKAGVSHFPIFLLIGILAWQFLASSLQMSSRSIIDNGGLIKKIYLAREIFPLSVVIGNLIHLFFSLLVLVILLLVFQILPSVLWVLFPLLLILQVLFIFGIALILASFSVYFRDIPILVESFLPVWYFSSPIFYPPSLVPEKYVKYYLLNPMASFLTAYRNILLENSLPSFEIIVVILFSTLIALVAGMAIFAKLAPRFAEEI